MALIFNTKTQRVDNMDIGHHIFLNEQSVPVFKWQGFEKSNEALKAWCQGHGLDFPFHFEFEDENRDFLTIYTGNKLGGKGYGYRVISGDFIAKLEHILMTYKPTEFEKHFEKEAPGLNTAIIK